MIPLFMLAALAGVGIGADACMYTARTVTTIDSDQEHDEGPFSSSGDSGNWLSMVSRTQANAVIVYTDHESGRLWVAACNNAACSDATVSVVSATNPSDITNPYPVSKTGAAWDPNTTGGVLIAFTSGFSSSNYVDNRLKTVYIDDVDSPSCDVSDGNACTFTADVYTQIADAFGDQIGSSSEKRGLPNVVYPADGSPPLIGVITYDDDLSSGDQYSIKVVKCADYKCASSTIITALSGMGKLDDLRMAILAPDNWLVFTYFEDQADSLKSAFCLDSDCSGPGPVSDWGYGSWNQQIEILDCRPRHAMATRDSDTNNVIVSYAGCYDELKVVSLTCNDKPTNYWYSGNPRDSYCRKSAGASITVPGYSFPSLSTGYPYSAVAFRPNGFGYPLIAFYSKLSHVCGNYGSTNECNDALAANGLDKDSKDLIFLDCTDLSCSDFVATSLYLSGFPLQGGGYYDTVGISIPSADEGLTALVAFADDKSQTSGGVGGMVKVAEMTCLTSSPTFSPSPPTTPAPDDEHDDDGDCDGDDYGEDCDDDDTLLWVFNTLVPILVGLIGGAYFGCKKYKEQQAQSRRGLQQSVAAHQAQQGVAMTPAIPAATTTTTTTMPTATPVSMNAAGGPPAGGGTVAWGGGAAAATTTTTPTDFGFGSSSASASTSSTVTPLPAVGLASSSSTAMSGSGATLCKQDSHNFNNVILL